MIGNIDDDIVAEAELRIEEGRGYRVTATDRINVMVYRTTDPGHHEHRGTILARKVVVLQPDGDELVTLVADPKASTITRSALLPDPDHPGRYHLTADTLADP